MEVLINQNKLFTNLAPNSDAATSILFTSLNYIKQHKIMITADDDLMRLKFVFLALPII